MSEHEMEDRMYTRDELIKFVKVAGVVVMDRVIRDLESVLEQCLAKVDSGELPEEDLLAATLVNIQHMIVSNHEHLVAIDEAHGMEERDPSCLN